MSKSNGKPKRSGKKDPESELTRLADAAFKVAAQDAIERAVNTGTPVIIWEDGQVKEVDPRTLLPSGKRRPKQRKRES